MKKTSIVCALGALAASGVLTTAVSADAADCTSYTNPVYIAGSTASQPIWAALAPSLPNISMIYMSPSSCVGLTEVTGGMGDGKQPLYMDPTNPSAQGVSCTFAATPPRLDIGVSDVFPATCAPAVAVGTGYKEFLGPVQVMLFAVPYQSTESAITADAAYTVLGWGGAPYAVGPWTNFEELFIRTPSSGTELMISSAIGLAASKWLSQIPDAAAAQNAGSSGQVVIDLQQAASGANPSQALGIVAADKGDSYRGVLGMSDGGTASGGLKVLAFQANDQMCGYLPDSDATHFDKINVRQGRYDIWGPLHLVTPVDGTGTPTNPNVATIINYLTATGLTTTQAEAIINVDASAHVIPQCAMQVSRSAEVSTAMGGGVASYQPPQGCGCYYESIKNGGTPYSKYCQPCTANADAGGTGACAAAYPACNFGFCEVQ